MFDSKKFQLKQNIIRLKDHHFYTSTWLALTTFELINDFITSDYLSNIKSNNFKNRKTIKMKTVFYNS